MSNTDLIGLYNLASKHSHYQVLATPLQDLIPQEALRTRTRHERERMDFILERVSIEGVRIADIGGNTGYFTFESIHRGARSGIYIDGNKAHADFVMAAVRQLEWQDRVAVHNVYFDSGCRLLEDRVDVCFVLNVLHHVGDDYGDPSIGISEAKSLIGITLQELSRFTDVLVLQLGFNWKGNPRLPLFQTGTKAEMLEFLKYCTREQWSILHVGIAESRDGGISYANLNRTNVERIDAMGEFLNRPLVILSSR